MGAAQSKFDPKTPLGCLVANFETLGLSQDLRKRRLTKFSRTWQSLPTPGQEDRGPPPAGFLGPPLPVLYTQVLPSSLPSPYSLSSKSPQILPPFPSLGVP
ncbi:hypothetical protein VULLAG_LOCUS13066 [Vulpes lagopus]